MTQHFRFSKALIGDQWHDNAILEIDADGRITSIDVRGNDANNALTKCVDGIAVPAMPNIHSHAFQRAMAGLAEYATSNSDSFWSWRDVMYRFAQNVTPNDLYNIARQLYLEMVTAGYSSVAEFHYLHHQPGGTHYDDLAEMSDAIFSAASDVGIALTHLPVLYMASGFGGTPLTDEQARFGHDADQYCKLLDQIAGRLNGRNQQQLGIAFHSLRAVTPEAMTDVLRHFGTLDKNAPVHIHISEQMKEVEDCMAWSGKRPVEWLLENHTLDQRWCLVHATHLTNAETDALAKSGAVAGLCPTTEANLGDGLFPLQRYLDQGGNVAIGSDSHISVSPVEELRWLEYGQRLRDQSRNIAATSAQPHSGTKLYLETLKGGALASGFDQGEIAVDKRANIAVLDPASSLLVGTPDKYLLDRFIFSGNQPAVKHVMIGGQWTVQDQVHPRSPEISAAFHKTMERLAGLLD